MADSREAPDLPGVRDDRTAEVRRLDYLTDQMIDLTNLVRTVIESMPAGNTQTVIHKQQGMGFVGVICASVCVMCVVVLILGAIVFVPDLHDIKAWQDILRRDVARLQATQQTEQRK